MSFKYLILFNTFLWLAFPAGAAELLVDLGYKEESGVITVEDKSPRNARITLTPGAGNELFRQGDFSALHFPAGENQHIEIKERFVFESGFSISAWIRPANSKGWMEVISCGLDSKPGGIRLRWGARGLVNVILGDGTGVLNAPANSAPSGAWTHLAIVSDGVRAHLFINGKEAASVESAGLPLSQPKSIPLTVGNYAGRKDAYPFRGEIGPVKIYDGPLSPQEIQALAEEKP